MPFNPEPVPTGYAPDLKDKSGRIWTPLYRHNCSFPPEIFRMVMINLIRNPNINSNHLFRADISLDCPFTEDFQAKINSPVIISDFEDFDLKTVIVRTLIPRNIVVDKPLDQTCLLFEKAATPKEVQSLVVYLPHISSSSESPFYHPAVHGIGFLHTFLCGTGKGTISIHYAFFEDQPRSSKLERTSQHLLKVLHKHGEGLASGYVKRVQHDQILPQAVVQNTYARLKSKYARNIIQGWVETTDPAKHVFEDLGIAAFLIELWREMYKDTAFPGFVDIGCGNGLLVHLLLEEGYIGWGFDARRRKSWKTYSSKAQESLKEMVLVPEIIQRNQGLQSTNEEETQPESVRIHDGLFPRGTFIVSNHADELTPWTPILANMSESPFMMLPCCSHSLNGARYRAPPPKEAGASNSAYASLVVWVTKLAKDCGWEVEREMLRIPSTRNTALIGRKRDVPFENVDVRDLVVTHGGADGWEENALKLVKAVARAH